MNEKEIPVLGMSCAACAISVEKTLSNTVGVKSVSVNYANHAAVLSWDEKETSLETLQEKVKSTGYDLLIKDILQEDLEKMQVKVYQSLRQKTYLAGILALPVFLIGMFWMDMPYGNYIMWALSTPILLIFGRQFFVQAFRLAKNGQANMDTLVALSTGIAYIYSAFNTFFPEFLTAKGIEVHVYFEAASVIIFFILLGKTLESGAKAGTGSALQKLMALQPHDLIVIRDGKEIPQKTADIKVGEIILIKPGQKIPLDGTVLEGTSYINESMLTGEPIPVLKEKGSKVLSGTVNGTGSFSFVAEQVGSETFISKIIQRVKAAQSSKAPIQKTVDKVSAIFVPVVLGIGIFTFLIWGFSGIEDAWLRGMLALITVWVIACPCALGLATPTAIMAAMGKAAEMGILIKDAESLEKGKAIDTIILDKTGTITEGNPKVIQTLLHKEWTTDDAAAIKAIESKSEHPLAMAITSHFDQIETPIKINDFASLPGKGVSGKSENDTYRIGTAKWLTAFDIQMDAEYSAWASGALDEGAIVVFAAKNETLIAIFKIADPIKATSKEAITEMKKMGIQVHMLTGDQQKTAAWIAQETGIAFFQAEMLPHEKADYLKKLKAAGRHVAMAGDGVNDSEALSLADLSIAMGQGTDIAMEVAEVTLVHSDLNQIPKTINLTKKSVQIIRQNLFWAFVYNAIGIPIAAGILYPSFGFLLNPMIAGAAMALSSVSVVTNSLRLRK